MLAAHRHGGRTDLASFARAWDRYTRAGRQSPGRRERELRTLKAMLEVSLAAKTSLVERSAQAVAEPPGHQGAAGGRGRRSAPARHRGARPLAELRRRPGWAWLRVFRRYDEYEAALERIKATERDGPPARAA